MRSFELEYSGIENSIRTLRSQRANHKSQVDSYLMEHKMAVAAIALGFAGANVAIDADNEFAEEAEEIGALVGVIAAIYVLTHMDEVAEVVEVMTKADAGIKEFDQNINSATDVQNALLGEIDDLRAENSQTEYRISELRREITNLGI